MFQNVTTSLNTIKRALKRERICSLEKGRIVSLGLSQTTKTRMDKGTQGLDGGAVEESHILL